MTTVFQEDGSAVACTVIGFESANYITRVFTSDSDGYDAVQVCFVLVMASTSGAGVELRRAAPGVHPNSTVKLRYHLCWLACAQILITGFHLVCCSCFQSLS